MGIKATIPLRAWTTLPFDLGDKMKAPGHTSRLGSYKRQCVLVTNDDAGPWRMASTDLTTPGSEEVRLVDSGRVARTSERWRELF